MTDANDAPIQLVPLAGSERKPQSGLQPAATLAAAEGPVDLTVVVRRRAPMTTTDALGSPMTRDDLAANFGADPADVTLVETTLVELGLELLGTDIPSRRLRFRGTVAIVSRVFGTTVSSVSIEGPTGVTSHRVREGGLSIPAQLDGVVTAVLGIDDRPQARTQLRTATAGTTTAAAPRATSVSYTPVELGVLYDFPADTDGAGQTIAIIELGGGFETSDLDTYFSGLGLSVPSVTAVGVDGAVNEPGKDPSGADGEVLLDIEVIGGLSPAANILVYFAPNTDAGFLDAVAQAAHATPTPVSISISWGQSEDEWTAQARTALDDAMLDAVALGATVTAAAGDNGSSDGSSDGANHADFPSSSPHALACGGTTLRSKGNTIATETVWNDGTNGGATGGGVSDVFTLPTWQQQANVPAPVGQGGGRGVPDVAGNADPQTGYQVLVDGTSAVYGGTSAVAPLWAALIARLVQSLGTPLGLLQPKLYPLTEGFRDITVGNNGTFSAQPGWDACTGLGSPKGSELLAALRASA
jgi:kumamolisin